MTDGDNLAIKMRNVLNDALTLCWLGKSHVAAKELSKFKSANALELAEVEDHLRVRNREVKKIHIPDFDAVPRWRRTSWKERVVGIHAQYEALDNQKFRDGPQTALIAAMAEFRFWERRVSERAEQDYVVQNRPNGTGASAWDKDGVNFMLRPTGRDYHRLRFAATNRKYGDLVDVVLTPVKEADKTRAFRILAEPAQPNSRHGIRFRLENQMVLLSCYVNSDMLGMADVIPTYGADAQHGVEETLGELLDQLHAHQT